MQPTIQSSKSLRAALAGALVSCVTLLAPMTALAADADTVSLKPAKVDKDPRISLLEAVLRDDAKAVSSLLLAGVDPNAREAERGPAIVMAATENSFAALAALLASADLNIEATNDKGETALMLAAFRGHNPTVQRLIDKGAAVNREGWTPLHYAASNGHVDTMNLLIKAGADINARSPNGTSAMMLAARMGHLTVYQELIMAGADPTMTNASGLTAADYLDRRGETERAARLRRYIDVYKQEKTVTN